MYELDLNAGEDIQESILDGLEMRKRMEKGRQKDNFLQDKIRQIEKKMIDYKMEVKINLSNIFELLLVILLLIFLGVAVTMLNTKLNAMNVTILEEK